MIGGQILPLNERQRFAYDFFKNQELELKEIGDKAGGFLPWHIGWRYEYFNCPYLLLEEDDTVTARFLDIFTNIVDISKEGKIVLSPMLKNEGRLGRFFTQTLEENSWRGILTPDAVRQATGQISAYFENGPPVGIDMFGNMTHQPGAWLVKYSKKEFVEQMYNFGRFRISPASEYANENHSKAVKDVEMERSYRLKALVDILAGRDTFNFQGIKIPIRNGVVPVDFVLDDYYLFSSCKEIDRRMPTDFQSNAALVIKDKVKFVSMLKEALLQKLTSWEFLEREVNYYDPYNDLPNDPNQEFRKHFSYSYQKEHRCILRQKRSPALDMHLEPFFVELGSLHGITEIVTAK